MRLSIVFLLAIICFFFLQTKTYSQPQLWEIYTISDQPFVNVTVDKYESDSLFIKSMDRSFVIHQNSIKYLIKRNDSHFGEGFLIGSVGGAVLVNVAAKKSDDPFAVLGQFTTTILGALIGGTIGGFTGAASGNDTKYNLEKLDTERKQTLLNKLFN